MNGGDNMGRPRKNTEKVMLEQLRPALSPQAREQQIAAYAYDLAEQQIRDGTASSQVITYFLKAGSVEQQRRIEKLEEENKLLRAKTENLESAKHMDEMYEEAMKAMKRYSGSDAPSDEVEVYD